MEELYIPDTRLHQELIRIAQEVNDLKDVDAVLEMVLFHARRLTNAVAGSLFLVEDGHLKFSYVQNDQLFSRQGVNPHIYSDYTLPMDDGSIVGHAAHRATPVIIDDAYHLPEGTSYSFNPAFDRQSGFHTQSVLALPLTSLQGRVVGVLQLINSRTPEGEITPFPPPRVEVLPLFTTTATVAIERGLMTRELILRMVRMAELRDPTETGSHVQRVGAYAATIYHQWAINHGVAEKEWRRQKDLIRIAAMLHDVGKVGISDLILKKPARLDPLEFQTMQWHTVYGARLFTNATAPLDVMAHQIALNHHEKWNGSGYPGHIADDLADPHAGKGKRGEEIPLCARITALADVFDALCSRRSYKASWSDQQILELVQRESGGHFDPAVVEAFFQVWETIMAIRNHFAELNPAECPALEERVAEQAGTG